MGRQDRKTDQRDNAPPRYVADTNDGDYEVELNDVSTTASDANIFRDDRTGGRRCRRPSLHRRLLDSHLIIEKDHQNPTACQARRIEHRRELLMDDLSGLQAAMQSTSKTAVLARTYEALGVTASRIDYQELILRRQMLLLDEAISVIASPCLVMSRCNVEAAE
jgi:hypothetical protein